MTNERCYKFHGVILTDMNLTQLSEYLGGLDVEMYADDLRELPKSDDYYHGGRDLYGPPPGEGC